MLPSEINSFLEPISVDSPCGVDLESSAVAELDRLAQGKPEQQIGSTVVAAEDADWRLVQRKSTEVLAASKDLRAAMYLTKALFRTEGWGGFAQGLSVLGAFVERYWHGLYPRLDPDDDNEPTMRINIMMNLADSMVLATARTTPLISSRALGQFSLKQLDLASSEAGASVAAGTASELTASLEAAGMGCDLAALQQTATEVRQVRSALATLETAMAAHVDAARAPTFPVLAALVRKADVFLAALLARRAPANDQAGTSVEATTTSDPATTPPTGWSPTIRSRAEVVQALNAIIGYYEKNEPSSPVPIFMARSKRLVMMAFVDIIQDLVPDALSTLDLLRGQAK